MVGSEWFQSGPYSWRKGRETKRTWKKKKKKKKKKKGRKRRKKKQRQKRRKKEEEGTRLWTRRARRFWSIHLEEGERDEKTWKKKKKKGRKRRRKKKQRQRRKKKEEEGRRRDEAMDTEGEEVSSYNTPLDSQLLFVAIVE
ncbi:hypothetical protein BHM03_00041553 [Ensete ventricosum]|nr:hypothetical protein BHM03_00041553 [Ensete ventricosum]